ncbi:hypothetical protein ACHHYP_01669 [Achlya hypogyna]|uniref:Uncharacterized protein n=1 Tax=Achlya hypogyna TaxID=1202772 RepID=A0A1V9Z8I5_ACHHY|nr:hypothetical protein ACHHYP_01669 [Achlya hypogyna]
MAEDDIRSRLLHLRNLEALHEMEDEVHALRAKVVALEVPEILLAREKGYINTESQLTFVTARNGELERMVVSSMQDATKAAEDRDRLAKKLAKLQNEANLHSTTLSGMEQAYAAEMAAKETVLSELQARLELVQTSNDALLLKEQALVEENEAAQAAVADLQSRLEASEASATSLHNVNHQVCYQLSETKHELRTQEGIIAANEKLASLVTALETQLRTLTSTDDDSNNETTRWQRSTQKEDEVPRCNHCSEAENRLAMLKKQLLEMTHQRDRLDSELQDCKVSALLRRELELTAAKAHEVAIEAEQSALAAANHELTSKVDSLEAYVQDVETSTAFEKYVQMKTENRCLAQRLQAALQKDVASHMPKPPAMLRKQSTNYHLAFPRPNHVADASPRRPSLAMPPISNQKTSSWFRI